MVTGCAGFIGSHVCERLLKKNYLILGIDNLNEYYDINLKDKNLEILNSYDNFEFTKDDICDTRMISKWKPEKIVHLASMAGVRYSINNPKLYEKINVDGFINIMEESIKNDVKLVIYASSSSVYGLNKKLPFSEEDEINKCNSPYACSKLAMEMYARMYYQLYKIKTIGLRFFTVYGPRGRPDMAPYKFLKAIKMKERFQKYGNGDTSRDYTYIDDIVTGIENCLKKNENIEAEIFNLGNSSPTTLNEFIKLCEDITGNKAIYDEIEIPKGDVPHTFADISKARKFLDFSPQTNIREGMSKMYKSM